MRTLKFGLLLLLLIQPSARASGSAAEVQAMQAQMQTDVNTVLMRFDPKGYAVVRVEPQTRQAKLPGTPFALEDLTVRNSKGAVEVASVSVKVFTQLEALPPELNDMITEIVAVTKVKPTVTVATLPATALETEASGENSLPPGTVALFVLILMAVVAASGFAALAVIRRKASGGKEQNVGEVLQSGLSRLSEAIDGMSSAQMAAIQAQQAAQEDAAGAGGATGEALKERDLVIEAMPTESLLALLADCYWSAQDRYAAFIWNRTPVEQRKKLVAKLPVLSEYGRFVVDLPEANLNRHQEPYYLAPMSLERVGNDHLTDWIRKRPEAFSLLSSLRADGLELTAKERIEVQTKASKSGPMDLEKEIDSLKPSEPRKLRRKITLQIRSEEEETELLAMKDLDLDTKADIRTLGWLVELETAEISEVLDAMSAQNLASAWVGPKEVLETLSKAMPAKKRELMQSYLEKAKPSRQSPAFLELHRASIERLKAKVPQASSEEKATPNLRAA